MTYQGLTHHARRVLDYLPEGVPLTGAEVGVLKGHNAASLLARRPHLNLYLVDHWGLDGDPPPYDRHGRQILDEALGRLAFAGSRATFVIGRSPGAASGVPDELDFAFIDGDHRYEAVLADLRAWWPKVRPGGWLFGHDLDNRTGPRWEEWGVREAAEKFAAEVGVSMEEHGAPEMVFAMRKSTDD